MLKKIQHFFHHHPFRREITAVLLLKIAAIFLLWWICFHHPLEPINHDRLVGRFTERS